MLDGDVEYKDSSNQCIVLSGTSFAAPKLSYSQALYLLGDGPVKCGNDVPPLGYANSTAATLDPSVWRNWALPDAVSKHCSNFTELSSRY
jgi:hypothetical protein